MTSMRCFFADCAAELPAVLRTVDSQCDEQHDMNALPRRPARSRASVSPQLCDSQAGPRIALSELQVGRPAMHAGGHRCVRCAPDTVNGMGRVQCR